jgi:hypothetical protein
VVTSREEDRNRRENSLSRGTETARDRREKRREKAGTVEVGEIFEETIWRGQALSPISDPVKTTGQKRRYRWESESSTDDEEDNGRRLHNLFSESE